MLLFIPRLISNGLVSSLTPHPLTAQTLVSPLNSGTPIVTTPSFEVLGFALWLRCLFLTSGFHLVSAISGCFKRFSIGFHCSNI